MSEIRTFGFQTVPKSKHKPVQILGRSDFRHSGFLGHTQNVGISACLDFRQLAAKWLATGFFGFVLTQERASQGPLAQGLILAS